MHEQRLAAACRVLEADLVEVVIRIGRDVGVVRPPLVKTLYKGVEVLKEPLPVPQKTVQVYLREKECQPLKVFPRHGPCPSFVDGPGVPHDILFVDQYLFLRDDSQVIPEEGTVNKGMIEMMEIVGIKPFTAFPERLGKVVEWSQGSGVLFGERVDAEEAHKPLIEDQLVTEGMVFGTPISSRPRHPCAPSFPAPFPSSAVPHHQRWLRFRLQRQGDAG
ncbi:MAG: hypothetical protein A4E72_00108 [Syntrophus sp. PtaU1.Bin208]|nr:MAG: hypothetical protein A4E72_00108 [Syntrophus sp. PtaU1.Bin208]